jgi:RNA polymerase sigma-70 factor (ECF subfamily)
MFSGDFHGYSGMTLMVAQISPSFAPPSARPAAARATRSRGEAQLDAALVRRFNSGDESAFGEIITRYRGRMLAIALSVLRNHADAEEIAQDTFVHAYRSLPRFRGDCSLAAWLHLIALNLSRNRYRYFFRRHRHETCSFDSTLVDDGRAEIGGLIASDDPDPAREATNREFLEQVTTCMGKLSAHQREILALRNLSDRTYEEISDTLGIGMGTVKSRIARARRNLRALLAETYGEGDPGTVASCSWFESGRPSGQMGWVCG